MYPSLEGEALWYFNFMVRGGCVLLGFSLWEGPRPGHPSLKHHRIAAQADGKRLKSLTGQKLILALAYISGFPLPLYFCLLGCPYFHISSVMHLSLFEIIILSIFSRLQ